MSTDLLDPNALAVALEQFAGLVREGMFADRKYPDQAVRVSIGMASPKAVRDVAAEFGTVAKEDDDWTSAEVTLGTGTSPSLAIPDYSGALVLSLYAETPSDAETVADTQAGAR